MSASNLDGTGEATNEPHSLSLEAQLRQYAELAVQVGLALTPGQRLIVNATLETAPFVRLIAEEAYRAGARLVDVQWQDEQLTLVRLRSAPHDSFTEFPEYRARGLIEHAEQGHAYLWIYATDPELLTGQDPERLTRLERTSNEHLAAHLAALGNGAMNWSVVAVPTPGWAHKVFPGEDAATAERKLWDTILKMVRANRPGATEAWKAHVQELLRRRDYLNARRYEALHFIGPDTDLRVGLAEGHLWTAGQLTSRQGQQFVPNMPTEEVFTTPHRERVNGWVSATKPLSYAGTLIEGIRMRFEAGRAVEVHADTGEDVLRGLLETDEGSVLLGEVALVPVSSPVFQSGLLFYNILFDENAASHLALGNAYAFAVQGGPEMTPEQRGAMGSNSSAVHVDWMIGSAEMDVDGVLADGTREAIMRAGAWVF